jgi:hypothetical protein
MAAQPDLQPQPPRGAARLVPVGEKAPGGMLSRTAPEWSRRPPSSALPGQYRRIHLHWLAEPDPAGITRGHNCPKSRPAAVSASNPAA